LASKIDARHLPALLYDLVVSLTREAKILYINIIHSALKYILTTTFTINDAEAKVDLHQQPEVLELHPSFPGGHS
jgi:hypothetical protein